MRNYIITGHVPNLSSTKAPHLILQIAHYFKSLEVKSYQISIGHQPGHSAAPVSRVSANVTSNWKMMVSFTFRHTAFPEGPGEKRAELLSKIRCHLTPGTVQECSLSSPGLRKAVRIAFDWSSKDEKWAHLTKVWVFDGKYYIPQCNGVVDRYELREYIQAVAVKGGGRYLGEKRYRLLLAVARGLDGGDCGDSDSRRSWEWAVGRLRGGFGGLPCEVCEERVPLSRYWLNMFD